MASDPTTIFDLYSNTLRRITDSPSSWADFLKVAGRLYKYPFAEQVLIYAQRPDAIACATYDLWVDRLHRYVTHGSKGIALIDDTALVPRLKYVFDVSDTRPLQKQSPEPYLWAVREISKQAVADDLLVAFGRLETADMASALLTAVRNITMDAIEDQLEDFVSNLEDSLWEELDEHSVHTFFRESVVASAAWSVIKRCGLEPDAYIDLQDFSHVMECNTHAAISCLGVAVNTVTAKLLRQVEQTIKRIDRAEIKDYHKTTRRKSERSAERGADIQTGRGVPSAQPNNGGAPGGIWEVRDAAARLPAKEQARDIHIPADPGQTHGTSDGNRHNGQSTGGTDREQDGGSSWGHRGAEGRSPDGVGRPEEQSHKSGGRNSDPGANLHVALGLKAVDENSTALFISEKLPQLLCENPDLKCSKKDVIAFFEAHPNVTQRAAFLKSSYSNVFTSIYWEGAHQHYIGYHANDLGLEVWDGSYLTTDVRFTIPWDEVAGYVSGLIEEHRYLDPLTVVPSHTAQKNRIRQKQRDTSDMQLSMFAVVEETPDAEDLHYTRTDEDDTQEEYPIPHELQPVESDIPLPLQGIPAYQIGDTATLRYGDKTLSGTVGNIGEIDVQLDHTGPYSWDRQIVNKELFETAIRQDARNTDLFTTGNFRITDMQLGEGGPKSKFAANIAAIKTLKQIESESRAATYKEQEILSRYVGWGGLPEAFDSEKEKWGAEYNQLKTLLTEEEYRAARASVLNAHYTSPTVIAAMYNCLSNLGFQAGNILEPAMGVGNFFGLLPESLNGCKLYGVELDGITGRIAKCLYPQADIRIEGFEETSWADNSFDVAIGNVPFGAYSVSDTRYDRFGFHIHDYFFAKSIDLVRPGGVVAFVSSRYTMDKKSNAVRKYLAQRCDLLGAIRLPCDAFRANAGTEVTTDILFLQKREMPAITDADWIHVGRTDGGLVVNQYFIDHPDMVLGELVIEHGLYGSEDLTCKPIPGKALSDLLGAAIKNIEGNIPSYTKAIEQGAVPQGTIAADPTVRNFSFTEVNSVLYYRCNGTMSPVETSQTGEHRIRGMIAIRNAVRDLIDIQLNGCNDDALHAGQGTLSHLYDAYTAQYGLLNSRGNKLAFSDDTSYPLLCALEILKKDGSLERKADMFTKRTILQEVAITHVDTATDALAVSIGDRACVDLEFMASLLGRPGEIDAIIEDLRGVIFRQPDAGDDLLTGWQTADEYLSGNVRQKLKVALEYAEKEPGRYETNVEALRAAQPVDLSAEEIGVRLGATWVPTSDYRQFIFDLLETPYPYQKFINVSYAAVNCTWNVRGKNDDHSNNIKARTTYGTKRINAYEIIEASLNLRDVQIFDVIDEQRVINRRETILALQKQESIRQAFRDWIWKDPERRTRLVAYYNANFNDVRPRQYNGAHIKFVGMNPEIKLRKHQVDAVARILYGGNTLLAHVVGAGKTWEMAAAAMEGKRLGLCQKSLFVVPSHLTEQWGAEFLQLYPAANILVATKKDFEKSNRKMFCARIATGDFDAVIIGHSQFERIPMSLDRQQAQLKRQISDIEQGIADAKSDRDERYTIKQMEYTRKTLEQKLKKLMDTNRKDDVVNFEELGTDRLFVDEAHYYKNLFLYTKMRNVAGIGQTEAAKSSDLYMKCLYMDEKTALQPGGAGRGTVFATGTPISNSMSELYTLMRYLQNKMLEEKGWAFFDAWAGQFGETVTAIELAPEGTGYRQKTRFARFYNLPELINYWKEVTDVQTADMLKLPVPIANYHNVVVQPTIIQRDMVRQLGERAELVRRGEVEPNVDNMLKITSDGRKLALDQRVINPLLPDEPGSKLNTCVDYTMQIWARTQEKRLAQMLFCDLSTPKPRVKNVNGEAISEAPFSAYYDIKDKLVTQGVPPQEIAFVHDAHTDKQKAELFAKVRAGEVRILLGSTTKMGAGTNAQRKLVALHEIDIPWRPGDIEQREGRIIRQGNENEEVDIYRYVTEGTFDAYSWQIIETKQKFIGQIMTSKSPARTCEDIDTTALSYAEVKALAAGNPKIKERMDLEVEVSKLSLLRSNYQNEHYRLEDQILTFFPQQIAQTEQRIKAQLIDIKIAGDNVHPIDTFSMEVRGQLYTKKDAAGEAILAVVKEVRGAEPVPVGTYRGFTLGILLDAWNNQYMLRLVGAASHSTVMSGDPHGNIVRINNVIERFSEVLETYRQELATLHRQMDNAKSELSKAWPQEEEWKRKSQRLDQLNIELNMEFTEATNSPDNDAGQAPEYYCEQDQQEEWEEEL